MKKTLLAIVILAASCWAQTANPNPAANVATNNGQFTLNASVMSLSAKTGTIPATDVGAMYAVSVNSSVRFDGIMAPNNAQGYFGGYQYFLPSKWVLAKTNFDPSTFQFYLTGSGGVVRFAGAQHAGFLAGGGINYDPTHKGKFVANLIEVRAARLPNVSNGVTAVVSGGMSLGW